jgi:D-aminopeptidase
MEFLRVDGLPVGRELVRRRKQAAAAEQGSIIIVVATDAPLIPTQCNRLAQRATIGLANVGRHGHNSSGDLFFAFATGNHIPGGALETLELKMLPHDALNPLFDATVEAVEEAILNALTAAETITGVLFYSSSPKRVLTR